MMRTLTLLEHGDRFQWAHEPPRWQLGDGLELTTAPDSDYWQRTHYGFQRDNGHFFFTLAHGDFTLVAQLHGEPNAQYDQCGLMARADAGQWVKCSAEYESVEHSRLGSVVTNHGYSDWASQDVAGPVTRLWYRLRREGDDILADWSADGAAWRQMRVTHLHGCPPELQVGVYACSPTGGGFPCRATDVRLELAGAGPVEAP
jgi:regulation of enolase protein 1 (concanavalin A-like superfamily)